MRLIERAGLRALHCLDPERAHGLALTALRAGLGPNAIPGGGPVTSPRLTTRIAGLDLPNPVGIAAGFDKNAEVIRPALAAGPGFVEIGAVTPRPQPGNPRPRLFRLAEDKAAINRFGFNNQGMEAVAPRLAAARGAGVIGVNLGANKDSADKAQDYVTVLTHLWEHADFFTINVSSPNTEKLRDLQGRAALDALLSRVMAAKAELGGAKPVFLKIAPDLTEAEIADIAEVALTHALDGVIATNTTLARDGLTSVHRGEAGGLSGQPLFERSTQVLRRLYRHAEGRLPLIGVGGVGSAQQAMAKIRAGASALQLYTAMIYDGISLPGQIARDLDRMLLREGLGNLSEAVGTAA